jgi:uncharacterized protein
MFKPTKLMTEPLDEVSVRVLGSLIEKELTTPDNYPLTLNALTAACNQTSNREPVMELDEGAVTLALDELARRGLARGSLRSDSRVTRYRQLLSEKLHLHQPELALLGVLMLRGPQTVGELRTRTARMFEFLDLRHVEITLESLMALEPPLVKQLERRAGQKEVRYAQLLAGEPPAETGGEARDADPRAPRRVDATARIEALEQEVGSLREELAEMQKQFEKFRLQFE